MLRFLEWLLFGGAQAISKTPRNNDFFFQKSVFQHVVPIFLIFDQELGLQASKAFKRFCEFYNITPRVVSTRFAQSNANIERLSWYLKKSCRIISSQNLGDWDDFLPFLTQALNSRPTIYSGYSPEMLTYFHTARKFSPLNCMTILLTMRNISKM